MGQIHIDIAGEIGIAPTWQACKSELVVRDAWAHWSPNFGLWELEQVFENAFCRVSIGIQS